MNTCFIVGSGDFTDKDFTPIAGDLIIAADGGYRHLAKLGVTPTLFTGDFDSLDENTLPSSIDIIRFPREKDDTDMGLALSEGVKRGFSRFRLYGGSGSRPDHFLANLQLLTKASLAGADIALICPGFSVYAVSKSSLTVKRMEGTVLSVFSALSEAAGVTLENVKYPLENACLTAAFPLGVSNEFTSLPARVSIQSGALWVFVYDCPNDD